jgi:hypothetical protein
VPRGRWEWLAFAVCLVGVAVLVEVLDVPHDRAATTAAAGATAPAATTRAATTTPATATSSSRKAPAPRTNPAQQRRPAVDVAAAPKLVLAAARGSCWLEVRVGSKTGPALYSGVVQQGQTLRFAKQRLWIRLGAAGNLDATLNGKRLASFPNGTVEVLVTARGVAPTG